MHGFGEKMADGDRETDRDERQFIGPNPPGGRWTKKFVETFDAPLSGSVPSSSQQDIGSSGLN